MTPRRLWAARILTTIAALFLLFDSIAKLLKVPQAIDATAQLGFPESSIAGIGLVLLACTLVYLVPRTSVVGALLLTGYLGGATAANVRVGRTLFDTVFPMLFAILIWAGIVLRDDRVRRVVMPSISLRRIHHRQDTGGLSIA